MPASAPLVARAWGGSCTPRRIRSGTLTCIRVVGRRTLRLCVLAGRNPRRRCACATCRPGRIQPPDQHAPRATMRGGSTEKQLPAKFFSPQAPGRSR